MTWICEPWSALHFQCAFLRRPRPYGFAVDRGVDAGEAAGLMVPAGNTPAPESGAAEAPGELWTGVFAGDATGEGFAAAGTGEFCGAACVFISSRRNALSAVLLWAYRTDNANVSAKKIPASQVVNFTSTLVVCAPKILSVTAPPNAAPSPSLFGRCIRITRTMSNDTSTKSARDRLISKFIGTRNINAKWRMTNDEWRRKA